MSPDREPGDSAFWETPKPGRPTLPPSPEPLDPKKESSNEPSGEKREHVIVAWARAIALGARDTAKDVLDEGRSGAREKRSQMWDRFDRKTKGRRTRQ